MSTAAHTEGPWSIENVEYGDEVTDDLLILGPAPCFRYVANVARCFQGERIPAMEQANARLLSAAPELLAALELLLADAECFAKHLQNSRCVEAARAAIAKATGATA